jgi:hypothetical protein
MRMWMSVGLASCVIVGVARAETIPFGIYSSGGPTNAVNNSVDTRLAGRDYVDGALVRIAWKDIETAPGVYDWSRLDAQFTRAQSMGLKISLGIINGAGYPTWLETQGMQTFSFLFRGTTPTKMPVPWDPVYLSNYTQFVAALGHRYNGNATLALVHMTNSSGNGFEMQLPSTPTDINNWNTIGYTTTREVNSYKAIMDAYAAAFSKHLLDVEVHPVLNSDTVAQQVVAYGNQTIGSRFGVFAAWWSQNNADNVYPGMYTLLKQAAQDSFATVQMVTNATNFNSSFGAGGFQGALDRAFTDGVRYFEIWDTDVLNSAYSLTLTNLDNRIDAAMTPEPATGAVMVIGGLTLLRRRSAARW